MKDKIKIVGRLGVAEVKYREPMPAWPAMVRVWVIRADGERVMESPVDRQERLRALAQWTGEMVDGLPVRADIAEAAAEAVRMTAAKGAENA